MRPRPLHTSPVACLAPCLHLWKSDYLSRKYPKEPSHFRVPSPRELYKKRYDLFILARISSVDAHLYTLVSTGFHILYNYYYTNIIIHSLQGVNIYHIITT